MHLHLQYVFIDEGECHSSARLRFADILYVLSAGRSAISADTCRFSAIRNALGYDGGDVCVGAVGTSAETRCVPSLHLVLLLPHLSLLLVALRRTLTSALSQMIRPICYAGRQTLVPTADIS